MNPTDRLRAADYLVLAIAALTVASAAVQIAAPGIVLEAMGLRSSAELSLMLALASAFSALFGAALFHTVVTRRRDRAVVWWAGGAKLCGPAVIAVGALRGIVDPPALIPAAYDLATGIAVLWYAATLPARPESPAPAAPPGLEDVGARGSAVVGQGSEGAGRSRADRPRAGAAERARPAS